MAASVPKLVQIVPYDLTGVFLALDVNGNMWCGHTKASEWNVYHGKHNEAMLAITWFLMDMVFST